MRVPLILFYQEEKSIRQVAQAIGISEDAAKQRISRARRSLRDELAPQLAEQLRDGKVRNGRRFALGVVAALPGPKSLTLFSTLALSKAALWLGAALVMLGTLFALRMHFGKTDSPAQTAVVEKRALQEELQKDEAHEQSEQKLDLADPDTNGGNTFISEEEIDAAWDKLVEQPLLQGRVRIAMPHLDTDGDGHFSVDELRAVADAQPREFAEQLFHAEARLKSRPPLQPTKASLALLKAELKRSGLSKVGKTVQELVIRAAAQQVRSSELSRYFRDALDGKLTPVFGDGTTTRRDGSDGSRVFVVFEWERPKRQDGYPLISLWRDHSMHLAEVPAGTPLADLGHILSVPMPEVLVDTLHLSCSRVGWSGAIQDSFSIQFVVSELKERVSPLLEGEKRIAAIEEMVRDELNTFSVGICLSSSLRYLDEGWESPYGFSHDLEEDFGNIVSWEVFADPAILRETELDRSTF